LVAFAATQVVAESERLSVSVKQGLFRTFGAS
jgi:hypothetical protein